MEVVNMRDKVENEQSYLKKQEAISIQNPSPPPPAATASPPSSSSSPTHEFSFTISLHPHPPPNQDASNYNHHHTATPSPPPEPREAIDLSPADDIFFHGHLLPLHLISHLPTSPRSSTNSMDSFTLPIKDLNDQNNPIGNTSFHYHHQNTFSDFNLNPTKNSHPNNRPKSKSFSLFGRSKWKKGCQDDGERTHEDQNSNNSKKKLKLEVAQLVKKYMKMVRPLLSFPKARRPTTEFHRQPYTFSGNLLSSRRGCRAPEIGGRGGWRGGEFSAPASMRTSPANSGVLLASGTVSPAKSTTSDSTMEELQAAIQAAIAHCKNSISMDEKIQSQN